MPGPAYELRLVRGQTYRQKLWIKSRLVRDEVTTSAVDVRGSSFLLTAWDHLGSEILTMSTDGDDPSIAITDGAAGEITLALDAEETAALAPRTATYALQWTTGRGDVVRLLYGRLVIDRMDRYA